MRDTPSTLDTRPSLLLRIRDRQDADAWQTFVNLYGPLIYRYGRRRGLQDADLADLTQEVLAEVAQSMRRFEYRPERGRFRDWLGTVTRRRLGRLLRKKLPAEVSPERLDQLASPQADGEWEAEFNAHVLRVALERARPHFEPATWSAFERAWLDNKSAPAAAAELGVPVEAVYLAKSRVLKRLEEEVLLLAEDVPQLVPLG